MNVTIYLALPPNRQALTLAVLPVLRSSMAIIGTRIILNVRGVLSETHNELARVSVIPQALASYINSEI